VDAELPPKAGDGEDDSDVDEDFAPDAAILSARRVMNAGGPWRFRIKDRMKRPTSPAWDPPVDRTNDPSGLKFDSREYWEELKRSGGYYRALSQEQMQSCWHRFAMAIMEARPATVRVDMPPVEEQSLPLQNCLRLAPRGAITALAWEHVQASCTPGEYSRLRSNRAPRGAVTGAMGSS